MSDCAINGWSIVASAQAYSNFAGILAGFLFFGLIYLLGRDEKRIEILLLFSASFIILAFAGYLYARISGFTAPSDSATANAAVCKGTLMAGMVAGAMLVIGAATMIVGLGYVLVSYDPRSDRSHLRRLATVATGGILIGTIYQLFASVNFYDGLLDWPNQREMWTLVLLAVVLVLALAGFIYVSSRGPGRRQVRDRYIEWAVYATGGFGIAGTVLIGVVTKIEPARWVAWSVIIVSLGFPAVIVSMLAGGAVDGKDEKARVQQDDAGSDRAAG